MNKYLKLIHGYDIYQNFDYEKYQNFPIGWHTEPDFYNKLIDKTKPSLILELGSWYGASAISMAKIIKQKKLNTKIMCVDTWLGSIEFIGLHDVDRTRALMPVHGFPRAYDQFIANVIYHNVQDIIIPLPNTFQHACDWLIQQGIETQLIYSDGDNGANSVYNDLSYAWPMLSTNGIIFGDDLTNLSWPGIRIGLNRFCHEHKIKYIQDNDYTDFWTITKEHN